MSLLSPDILMHLGLAAGGGLALQCAVGFCKHPEHAWRKYLSGPLFLLFLYLEAVVTVNLLG